MLPVLPVYNLDREWPAHDIHEAVEVKRKIGARYAPPGPHGQSDPCLQCRFTAPVEAVCTPDDWIVFNWCEGLPGVDHSEAVAARMIADLNLCIPARRRKR